MKNNFTFDEKIFIAGSSGMVGSAIKRALIEQGFYDDSLRGILLTPNSEDLDLRNFEDLKKWFEINKPTIVILSAAKVGGIYANNNNPFDFILENFLSYFNTALSPPFLTSNIIFFTTTDLIFCFCFLKFKISSSFFEKFF